MEPRVILRRTHVHMLCTIGGTLELEAGLGGDLVDGLVEFVLEVLDSLENTKSSVSPRSNITSS